MYIYIYIYIYIYKIYTNTVMTLATVCARTCTSTGMSQATHNANDHFLPSLTNRTELIATCVLFWCTCISDSDLSHYSVFWPSALHFLASCTACVCVCMCVCLCVCVCVCVCMCVCVCYIIYSCIIRDHWVRIWTWTVNYTCAWLISRHVNVCTCGFIHTT